MSLKNKLSEVKIWDLYWNRWKLKFINPKTKWGLLMATYRDNNIQLHQSCFDSLSMIDLCTSSLCPMFVISWRLSTKTSLKLSWICTFNAKGKRSKMLSQMVVYRWFTLEEPVKTSPTKTNPRNFAIPPIFSRIPFIQTSTPLKSMDPTLWKGSEFFKSWAVDQWQSMKSP